MQAVQNSTLGITQVVFYQPGTIKLNSTVAITAQNPCIVMVKMSGNALQEITVAEPTTKLKTLQLTVTAPVNGSGNNWQAAWDKAGKQSEIKVDLPGGVYAGQSVVISFGK